MSHFTVAVICDHPDDIIKLLAPYQENNMGDCPMEFMEFNKHSDEESDWEDVKDEYPTFEEYLEKRCGYKKDEETGEYGYWENPNAKWDWYELGGRWMGSLLIKENEFVKDEAGQGRPGVFENKIANTPNKYVWVDVCKVGLIQWDKMREIAEFELLKNEGVDGDIWEILLDEKHEKRMDYTWYKVDYFKEKYGNKENYIKSQVNFATYAVITPDGEWHAPGDMGWFGFSSESNEDENLFNDNFYNDFIEPYQDKFIAIMDCHI